jgi:hypothetical protein
LGSQGNGSFSHDKGDQLSLLIKSVGAEPEQAMDKEAASLIDTGGGKLDALSIAAALLIGAGCYFGAMIGFALTFQPKPISILWPPNSILLGALLLAPTNWWWPLLLCAFPAHLAAQTQKAGCRQ